MKSISALAAAVCLSLTAAGAHAAELLINGGFETGDLTGWSSTGSNYQGVVAGPSYGLGVNGAEDGTFYLTDGDYQTDSTVSQTFADVAGAAYSVSGWVASDGGAPSDWSLNINGGAFATANPAPADGWVKFSTTFVGTGSDTLSLVSRNDPNTNEFDNFQVIGPAAGGVPEPAAWALMIVGFGGVGAVLRRRRGALTTAA